MIPPYKKYDAYMRACNTSGALEKIKEYDRMSDVLSKLRDLDFGVSESWTATDEPRYKGCEPMRGGKEPVHCD